jgi:hypothetical protein
MDNCSNKILTHASQGTTQTDRYLSALEPASFLVDEHSLYDRLYHTQKVSKYLLYFNEQNEEDGNWLLFFTAESFAIIVANYSWAVEGFISAFDNLRKEILLLNNVTEQKKLLVQFYKELQSEITHKVNSCNALNDEISIKEFYNATGFVLQKKIDDILLLIDSTTLAPDILLVSDYLLAKQTQELFGTLMHWKQTSLGFLTTSFETYPAHSPHYALVISILKLLQFAQTEVNQFTQRHLDFYFKDVLQLPVVPSRSDYAHIAIEPQKNTKDFLITKGSIFLAGKTSLGSNKYFKSTADQAINHINIKELKSNYSVAAGHWQSKDLLALNAQNKTIQMFDPSVAEVSVGFVIASPLFYLRGGTRTISLLFENASVHPDDYHFYLSGEKDWVTITNKKIDDQGLIHLIVSSSEKAIIPFDVAIHKGVALSTTSPVLKMIPKQNRPSFNCSALTISISVEGLKNFVVGTDSGVVDVLKPFEPYGPFPKSGNGFVVACNEIFVKKNAEVTFLIDENSSTAFINDPQKTRVRTLRGGRWSIGKKFINPYTVVHTAKERYVADTLPTKDTLSGFVRFQLKDSAYSGQKYLQNYLIAAKDNTAFPLLPVITSISIDYSISEKHEFDENDSDLNAIKFFHILPFGFLQFKPNGSLKVLPSIPNKGYIYVGFENAQEGNSLSLLLQVAESTSNPQLPPAQVRWHFLNGNSWTLIPQEDLGDATQGLQQSGLLQYTIPAYSTSKTTILTPNLFWLRIHMNALDGICKWIGIHTQALKVVLCDSAGNDTDFTELTPAGTINKMAIPVAGIKSVTQPYGAFNGRPAEDSSLYYQRNSERLRHKLRAISIWDYERIILKEFPEVYKVKCLNHYRYTTNHISNVAAGYISIIPIAFQFANSMDNAAKPLLPLGKMQQIQKFIKQYSSPHARIVVKPPVFEKVRIRCKVKYKTIPGADTHLYATQLKDIINQYLSPWAFGSSDIQFTSSIVASALIQLIDNQSFVDFITDFQMDHLLLNPQTDAVVQVFADVKEIVPQTDYTLFLPNDNHNITELAY